MKSILFYQNLDNYHEQYLDFDDSTFSTIKYINSNEKREMKIAKQKKMGFYKPIEN